MYVKKTPVSVKYCTHKRKLVLFFLPHGIYTNLCLAFYTVAVNVTLYSHLPLAAVLPFAVLLRRRCCWGRAVQQSIDIACPR